MEDETILNQTNDEEAAAKEVAGSDAPLTVEEQLARVQTEADSYKDSWLRVRAEFANARKRMDRERTEAYSLAVEEVIGRLLPVIDDFQRAMSSVPEAVADDSWFAGIELIYAKLVGLLETFDIQPIEAVGQHFDPNLHEAVLQEASDQYPEGVITKELQTGYQRKDKVIRPAMVAVAR
jgi:molecular chaperone GrpE